MLSNIIILLLKITSLLSLPYSPNISHYFICFPHYLFDICLLGGSFTEWITQVFELVYLFYFLSFPLPLTLFTLPLSLTEHHHFHLLTSHFQLFLPHMLGKHHHFIHFTLCLPITLPPACAFSSISATYSE
jgi:hypothetical protein